MRQEIRAETTRRHLAAPLLLLATLAGCADSLPEEKQTLSEPAAHQTWSLNSGQPDFGRWHPAPDANAPGSPDQSEVLSRLKTLPYSAGSFPATSKIGVTQFDRPQVNPGLNLFNSGHGAEAFLTDLEGAILHHWAYPIEKLWPQELGPHQSTYWRRVSWLSEGDILAVFEGIGLIRLDRESRLEWAFKGPVHHQAVVDLEGNVVTLTRRSRKLPRINPDSPIMDDHLAVLSPQGELISETSLLEAFERSSYKHLLAGMKRRQGDIFHTNSIQVLDGSQAERAPWMRRGNLLLSMLFLDTVCVLDPRDGLVVWALRGDQQPRFEAQHDPRLLPGGRLLLFDNWGRLGKSKVIEFDPITREVFWQYPADRDSAFYTATCGTSQRLANGNTLLTESEKGRAIEVTPSGEVVWEFFNPHRAGENRELIATLFELKRVPESHYSWR